MENKDKKHENDAKGGWHRYDVRFSLPVYDNQAIVAAKNYYTATLVVKLNDAGTFVYDIINIKKEASKPFESEDRTVENRFFLIMIAL